MAEKLPLPLGEQQATPPVMAVGNPSAVPITSGGQEVMSPAMTTEQMNNNGVGDEFAPLPTSGDQLPLPLGEQQATPPVMAVDNPPAVPMTSGGQEAVSPVMTTEQMNNNGVGAEFAPLPTSGDQQQVTLVEPVQGTFSHIAGSSTAGLTTGYAPVAIMTDPQPMAQAVQEQAAPVFHGLPNGPEFSTPTAFDQIQSTSEVQVPTTVLNEHLQVSGAFPASVSIAVPCAASPGPLFVPWGTKHERSDSLDPESASKRLKSESVSSQASALSSTTRQLSPAEVNAEPLAEHTEPNLVPSAPRDALSPQVPANVSPEAFQTQLLSAASEGAVPKVIINAAIPAHDPSWPRNKPHHPGFHPNVPKIEAQIRILISLVSEAHQKLKEKQYNDDILDAYVTRLSKHGQLVARQKEIETIALLGDMGIGKSEAYEALVGQVGIAIKSDSGRGTHFPIEGHNKKDAQTTSFEVTIVWKTRSEFKRTVQDASDHIYAYLDGDKVEDEALGDAEDSEEEAENDADPLGSSAAEREHDYREAVKHLLPLVQEDGNTDFQNGETLTSWLGAQKANGCGNAMVIDKLLDRIMDLRKRNGVAASTSSIAADSAKEATAILERFSPPAPIKSTDDIRWEQSYHLKQAQLHFDNDMGAEGIVVADVPGRNDPDAVMSAMIKDYVKTADRHLVMAPAGRPLTRESDGYLKEAIKSKKPMIFVVTKIDVKDDLTTSERAALSDAEMKEFLSAEAVVEEVKATMSALEAQKTALEHAGEYQQAFAASQQVAQVRGIALHAAKSKLHQLQVEARNRKEYNEIHAQYAKLAGGKRGSSDLEVAFISAKEYNKHLRGEPALLDYEATGVPKLFRLLYRSIASKRMNKVMQLCYIDLPHHLNTLKHVLNKTPVQRFDEFRDSIVDSLKRYQERIIPAAKAELESWIGEHISAHYTNIGSKSRAAELMSNWTSGVRSPTFLALCKHNGNWKDRSCNEDIQQKIAGGLNQRGYAHQFNCLYEAIQAASDGLGSSIVSRIVDTGAVDMADFLFGHIETKLDQLHFHELLISRVYIRELRRCKLSLRQELEEHFDLLLFTVFDIKNKALVGGAGQGTESTYVGTSMEATYSQAAAAKKENMIMPEPQTVTNARGKQRTAKQPSLAALAHKKRMEMINKKLQGKKSVFNEVHSMIERDLQKTVAEFIELLEQTCTKVSDILLTAFNGFYVRAGMKELQNENVSAGPLTTVVERVLEDLPADPAEVAEAIENDMLAPQKGTIEKLIDECLSWDRLYPSEQRD